MGLSSIFDHDADICLELLRLGTRILVFSETQSRPRYRPRRLQAAVPLRGERRESNDHEHGQQDQENKEEN